MKNLEKFRYPVIFIIIASLLWSMDSLIRVNLYSLPAIVIVFFEHVFGLILILPLSIGSFKQIKKLSKKEIAALIFVGVFSGAVATYLYTQALIKVNFITISVVALLQQLQPIWAIIGARIILKEKISSKYIPWALLAVASTYLITFKNLTVDINRDGGTIVAAVFALLAGMLWASSTSLSKVGLKHVPSNTALMVRFAVAIVAAVVITFATGAQAAISTISNAQFIYLGLLALINGALGTGIYYFGLKRTPAKVSAIAELTWPASAIFIDYFFFHNFLTITQIIGVVILVFSIYKVSKLSKKENEVQE
jgi:drug/metabolite transporter (DMT)-like permease